MLWGGRREMATSSLYLIDGVPAMPQPNDLSRSLVALDQNSTIIAVIELSQSSWLVAGMLPGIERQPRKKLEPSPERRLCQLSRLLVDYVSAILPRAQAVSRMPSAVAALRMCCQRRVAAGTCWRMRDRQRRKFRSSSWPQQYRLADPVLFNPSIGRHRPLMPR